MEKSEAQWYDQYQTAKTDLSEAVKKMKEAGENLDYQETAMQEDMKALIDEQGFNVEDWII